MNTILFLLKVAFLSKLFKFAYFIHASVLKRSPAWEWACLAGLNTTLDWTPDFLYWSILRPPSAFNLLPAAVPKDSMKAALRQTLGTQTIEAIDAISDSAAPLLKPYRFHPHFVCSICGVGRMTRYGISMQKQMNFNMNSKNQYDRPSGGACPVKPGGSIPMFFHSPYPYHLVWRAERCPAPSLSFCPPRLSNSVWCVFA